MVTIFPDNLLTLLDYSRHLLERKIIERVLFSLKLLHTYLGNAFFLKRKRDFVCFMSGLLIFFSELLARFLNFFVVFCVDQIPLIPSFVEVDLVLIVLFSLSFNKSDSFFFCFQKTKIILTHYLTIKNKKYNQHII